MAEEALPTMAQAALGFRESSGNITMGGTYFRGRPQDSETVDDTLARDHSPISDIFESPFDNNDATEVSEGVQELRRVLQNYYSSLKNYLLSLRRLVMSRGLLTRRI
jgi:hypothetical protein